jgi:hypothetical protein
MKIINSIKNAFENRSSFKVISLRQQLPEEISELKYFLNKDPYELTGESLELYFEAINWFSPDAFCYFLPGIIITSIREKSDLLMCDSIIYMLDRSPNIEYWDDYFIERWSLLTRQECDAVQNWLLWLLDNSISYDGITIDRAFETLELLKSRL